MAGSRTIHKTIYASAARSATSSSSEQLMEGCRGLHLVINVSSVTSTPSVTPKIEGYSSLANVWYTVLEGSAITATGTTVLKVYPGIAAAANASASDIMPDVWRVTMTHGDSDSITFSIAAHLVP